MLVLLGALYGAGYAGIYLPDVKLKKYDLLKNAIEMSSESATAAKKEVNLYVNNILFGNRMGSIHSHMTLIGILSLTLANWITQFQVSVRWLWIACIFLILSGLVLPLGVFIESWESKIGGLTAMLGGTCLLISLVIFLIGALRAKLN